MILNALPTQTLSAMTLSQLIEEASNIRDTIADRERDCRIFMARMDSILSEMKQRAESAKIELARAQ